ncbi:hypothetical protein ACT453_45715, partial [Bacillus sp. D-CC]
MVISDYIANLKNINKSFINTIKDLFIYYQSSSTFLSRYNRKLPLAERTMERHASGNFRLYR